MAHDVFISYSTKDKLTADAVCATLEGRGIRCWIAPRDILPGMDWGEAIIDAIAESRVMVLVFSENANQSPQIKREVERAVSKGLAVVPVRIQDVPMSKSLEFFVSTPHWMDALTPPLERHLVQLADTLRLLLERMGPRKGRASEAAHHAVETQQQPVPAPMPEVRTPEHRVKPQAPPTPPEPADASARAGEAGVEATHDEIARAQSEVARTAEHSTTSAPSPATPPPRPDPNKSSSSPPPVGKSVPPVRPPPRPPQRGAPTNAGPFPFVNKIFGPVSPGIQVLIVVGGGLLVLTILSCLFFSCLGGLAQ